MRIIVYPHSMELGGSQLNAIQMAAAVRDRGHEVIVLSEAGPLVDRVKALSLEHIELSQHRKRPSLAVARMIGHLTKQRQIDVVHGHEWPPIIEAFLGLKFFHHTPVVGTVMSMSVAPFLPRSVPLTVGTELIRQAAIVSGHLDVQLLEPPVDIKADHPSVDGAGFRAAKGIRPDEVLIVIVCRLVPDLKLEGLLAACAAVGELAITERAVRLVIVGDGQASDAVARRAADVNAAVGRDAILLTGGLADPAPAYAAADIIVGQGGSALRGMAFVKPLVVIGEEGFSELLTPESAPLFLRQGWYGLGPGSLGAGVPALRLAIESLVNAPELRRELGLFGRRLVEERFSLSRAAQILEQRYISAIQDPLSSQHQLSELARCTTELFNDKIRRRYQRWLGIARTDDSNARSRIAAVLASGKQGGETAH